MLQNVGQHDGVDASGQALHAFEVGDEDLIEAATQIAEAVDVVLEADRSPEVIAHRRAELTAGGAEIEQHTAAFGEAADQANEDAMAASCEILECVDVRHCEIR